MNVSFDLLLTFGGNLPMTSRPWMAGALVALVVAVTASFWLRAAQPAADPAVERARQQIRMLDDLYKTAVVLITEHYVEDEGSFPAGSAAIALFDAMKQKGWHEVRLVDATGQPINDDNSPRDAFERAAVEQLTGGESNYEQLTERDGSRYLRVATPVPVVLEKCTMCHEHYREAAPGAAIGVLSYTLKVE